MTVLKSAEILSSTRALSFVLFVSFISFSPPSFQRFAPNFEAEQVGILELPYMTEERLQSLGIPLGPRLRILQEAKKT